jgi:hypothetical protein
VLGWEPQMQLADGLERTIEYFRDRLLTQQIAELAALARLGKTMQPAMQAAPHEIASDQSEGPSAQTA